MSKFSKALKKAERSISNLIPHQHSAQTRAEMAAAKEQLDFYKEQKEAIGKEQERVTQERDTERKKLHEKQIRSMRRSYRSPGFMEGPGDGTADTLG
jgi:uncharacterized protein (DUF3084 family)